MKFDKFKFWKLIFQLWKLLFEYETWYLILKNSYLNLEINISVLKFFIWIWDLIFKFDIYYLQWKSYISIKILLFEYENWYFPSKNSYLKSVFLVFKNWYFSLKIDIWFLNFFIWIRKLIFKSWKLLFEYEIW
jgi:hypothetical protein